MTTPTIESNTSATTPSEGAAPSTGRIVLGRNQYGKA